MLTPGLKDSLKILQILAAVSIGSVVAPAHAYTTSNATTFGYVPAGQPAFIEGLTADPLTGNVIGASFDQTVGYGGPANQNIYTWNSSGTLIGTTPFSYSLPGYTNGPQWSLGNTVIGDNLYQIDVDNGNVVKYNLSGSRIPSTVSNAWGVCGGFVGNPGLLCGLNDLAGGPDGNLYITDNAAANYGDTNSAIYRLNPTTGQSGIWYTNSLLNPAPYVPGAPNSDIPYGANGIIFNKDYTDLFIANMNQNSILKLSVTGCDTTTTGGITGGCQPGTISTFASGGPLSGPDNMAFDPNGNLWVASGQNNTVIQYDPSGQVLQIVGGYYGLAPAPGGLAANTLAQPSGIVYNAGRIYIGNEANPSLTPPDTPIDFNNLTIDTIAYIDVPEPVNILGGLLTLSLGLTLKHQLRQRKQK